MKVQVKLGEVPVGERFSLASGEDDGFDRDPEGLPRWSRSEFVDERCSLLLSTGGETFSNYLASHDVWIDVPDSEIVP